MDTIASILNGFGGQVLLAGCGALALTAAAALGKRWGITDEQAKQILEVAKNTDLLNESDIAKEAQRRLREKLKNKLGLK